MSRLLLAALACSTAAAELVVVQPFGSPVPRQFLLLSDGVDCRGDCPAVVLLHGFSENPYLLSKSIGFEPLLKGRGWIGAVPFGLSPNNRTGPAACCDVGCDAACCEAGQHLAQNESAQCDWNTDRQTSGAWPAAADDTAFLSFLARYLVGKGADEKRIFATGMSAGAMMVQRIADNPDIHNPPDDEADTWRRVMMLMATGTDAEILDPELSAERYLFRLFHEEGVRVTPSRPVSRGCRCSEDRVFNVLVQLPHDELFDLADEGWLSVTCEFCNETYRFTPEAVEERGVATNSPESSLN